MTDNDNIRLDRIETTLGTHGEKFDAIETTLEIQRHTLEAQGHTLNEQGQRLDRIETVLTNLVTEIKIYDSKLDTYQKASQQIVNIAFGLLATSALAIIIPAVLNR